MFIGLSGAKGSGKSTLAEFFKRKYGFKVISFAHPLKIALALVTQLEYDDFDAQSKKELVHETKTLSYAQIEQMLTYLSDFHVRIPRKTINEIARLYDGLEYQSNRQLMQLVGTDLVRENVSQTYWIECANKEVQASQTNEIIFSDARFPDERAYVKSIKGLNVLIIREMKNHSSHKSELSLGKPEDYDVVITNDSTTRVLEEQFDLWYRIRK
jgi:predicted ATPase